MKSTNASALIAAAAPVAPPASWFDQPKFSGPTPLTITPEGRVYGHAALWGTWHIVSGLLLVALWRRNPPHLSSAKEEQPCAS